MEVESKIIPRKCSFPCLLQSPVDTGAPPLDGRPALLQPLNEKQLTSRPNNCKRVDVMGRWLPLLKGIMSISQMYQRLSQIVMKNQVQVLFFQWCAPEEEQRIRFH